MLMRTCSLVVRSRRSLLFCASLGFPSFCQTFLWESESPLVSHKKEQKPRGMCLTLFSAASLSHPPRPTPDSILSPRQSTSHTIITHTLLLPCPKRSEVAGCPASRRITHAYFIAATMPAVVTPFSSKTWSPGAERPNESTPSTLSAYLYHEEVTPASTARVIALFGSTSAW